MHADIHTCIVIDIHKCTNWNFITCFRKKPLNQKTGIYPMHHQIRNVRSYCSQMSFVMQRL